MQTGQFELKMRPVRNEVEWSNVKKLLELHHSTSVNTNKSYYFIYIPFKSFPPTETDRMTLWNKGINNVAERAAQLQFQGEWFYCRVQGEHEPGEEEEEKKRGSSAS